MPGIKATTLTSETIDLYRQWCIARGRSHNTVKAYVTDLNTFLREAGETMHAMTKTWQVIQNYEYEELAMAWLNLNREKLSPKTTARRLTSIKGFAKWAGWGNVLEEYIAPQAGKTIPHPIPEGPDGLRRMIEKARNHEQVAVVALGGFVGCRISESLSVTPSSFDVHDRMLTIRGKGDKTRVVPVSEEAWDYLVPALVFAGQRGNDSPLITYKDRFARQIVTNLGARADLKRPVSSHDLRATFATAALDRTKNIRVVQELLGHSNAATTEIYTGVTIASMREAVDF